jgi:SAM-dependent methyltransferase
MSCENPSSERAQNFEWKGPPDLSCRAALSEMMDGSCIYPDFRQCLHDLAQVNRTVFAYRPTLQWLEQFVHLSLPAQPLHIVDVGCGGGDMLRRIERWAAQRRLPVRLTGLDMNPFAIRAAREFTPAKSEIQWIVGEAGSLESGAEPIDVVISSLFTHHLADDEIVRFLIWMEGVAHYGWFINDLYRSRTSYLGFKALALAARWHRFVRHDGPVSILRSFLPAEWQRYAEASGLLPGSIRIDNRWPARLCVARMKQQ